MHLIHHVVVMAVGAARDNFDCIGSMICLACRLHHSSKCPTAKQVQLSICSRAYHQKQSLCTFIYWTDIIAFHARSCSLLDWLHALMGMHMASPLYSPPVVQGIPAKNLTPLYMIPVGQQDFCICPASEEVTPLLAGLLAVAPQLLASALIVHHLKAIHLQQVDILMLLTTFHGKSLNVMHLACSGSC